jgi:hypothetical protein
MGNRRAATVILAHSVTIILPVCCCTHGEPGCAHIVQYFSPPYPVEEMLHHEVTVDIRKTSQGRRFERSTTPCGAQMFSHSLSPRTPRPPGSRLRSPFSQVRIHSNTFSRPRGVRGWACLRQDVLDDSPRRQSYIVHFHRLHSQSSHG